MSLFSELKRRNVFRVAIAYIVIAWLVMQVTDVILNNIAAPGWVFRAILLVLGIGFLFALFFAWAFEMTPEGLKKESEVDRSQSITPQTGRKLNNLIIALMALAIAYFVYDKFVLTTSREAALVEAATQKATEQAASQETAGVPAKSIAVLPFIDMSQDKDQEYLSDGIAEELLNLLAKIPELKVTSRSSAFAFKGEKIDIPAVAQKLGVAHILEGSVRKAGNQVRITAQLIEAGTDTHLWSETYDRSLDNIFAVQDEIAAHVVEQLKVELLGEAPKVQKTDPDAYALFLQGRYLSNQLTPEGWARSSDMFKKALEIDPGYEAAWGELARNYNNQALFGDLPSNEGAALAREAAQKALAINPDSVSGMVSLAYTEMTFAGNLQIAASLMQRASQLDPGNFSVLNNSANLLSNLGRLDEALMLSKLLVKLDPVNPIGHYNLGNRYLAMGQLEQSESSYRMALSLSPGMSGAHHDIGLTRLLRGDMEAARESFAQEPDKEYLVHGRALTAYAMGRKEEFDTALQELIDGWGEQWPSDVASLYAWSGDVDKAFQWLEKSLEITGTLLDARKNPLLTALTTDPRWPALLERAGASQVQLDLIEFNVNLPEQ